MMNLSKLQREKMIIDLLTDCVAARRVENALSDIINAHGGNENHLGDSPNNTLEVCIDLALLEYDNVTKDELKPHLLEYFYSGKVDVSGQENASNIARHILLGWGNMLK